jgi:hypothetical protein
MQLGIWVSAQNLLQDRGKPRKILIELALKIKGIYMEGKVLGEGMVRDTLFKGSKKKQFFFSVLNVPRECLLVLLVGVIFRTVETLGSEKLNLVKRRETLSNGFSACDLKYITVKF